MFDPLHTGIDQGLDFLEAVAERPANASHFRGNHRKATPCSPARAASTAAFSANIFVWNAMLSITLMMSDIFL